MVLAEGVYSPSNDYVSPMTFTQGSTFNLMGYSTTTAPTSSRSSRSKRRR